LAVFSVSKANTGSLTRGLADPYQISRFLAIKLVPGAHALQPAVEAAIEAERQSGATPDQIAKILVSGPQIRTIASKRAPENMIEAIHSLPYFLASAVADKDFSWVHTTPEKIHRPEVARLITLVEADPAPKPVHYDWSWGATVTIVTKSGVEYSSTVDAPKGSAPRGIDWSEVDAKYQALLQDARIAPQRIDESLRLIHEFDRLKNVSQLTDLLRSP
jgi:2-methylcitrate dehydratase PrpD